MIAPISARCLWQAADEAAERREAAAGGGCASAGPADMHDGDCGFGDPGEAKNHAFSPSRRASHAKPW